MRYLLPDDRWTVLQPIVAQARRHRGGQPPVPPDRQFLEALLYPARTGVAWWNLPAEFGRSDAVYNRFRRWVASGRSKAVPDPSTRRPGRSAGRSSSRPSSGSTGTPPEPGGGTTGRGRAGGEGPRARPEPRRVDR